MRTGPLTRLARIGPAVLLLIVATACGAKTPAKISAIKGTLLVDGRTRSYLVHTPSDAAPAAARPLLIALHGGGGRGKRTGRRFAIDSVVEREGIIAVYPDGFENNWNDGRKVDRYAAHRENVDDVAFLTRLIDHLAGRYRIDRRRVYVVGISNGGMMAIRLACEAAERIAAAAVVVASMPADLGPVCRPSRPVPIVVMNGTADPLMPFTGGDVRFGRRRLGRVWSTARTVAFWARHNGCPAQPARTRKIDADPGDRTTVTRAVHGPCRSGAGVVLYTVNNGGHAWPGAPKTLPRFLVGRQSHDIDGTAEIWRFFRRHRR